MKAKIRVKKTSCCSSDCCCGTDAPESGVIQHNIPVVSTKLSFSDILGAWKVRWGIGRMNYKVDPGLYAVGSPDSTSPILVSANYKLTFDFLRRELSGLDCWLLILNLRFISLQGTFQSPQEGQKICQDLRDS